MTRAKLVDLLGSRGSGSALGAFTCYELQVATGTVLAAERFGTPVILLVPPSAMRDGRGRLLIPALCGLADRAHVPVCIQLDHAKDVEMIHEALDLGIDAVLADGSQMSFAENGEFVASIASIAKTYGAAVEAELGFVPGDEDRVTLQLGRGSLTEPGVVPAFLRKTRADLLAISVGNKHGGKPETALDWDRLEAIHRSSSVPLALHGASGLAAQDLRRAAAAGVAKININAELRRTMLDELGRQLPRIVASADVGTLVTSVIDRVSDTVHTYLSRLSPS